MAQTHGILLSCKLGTDQNIKTVSIGQFVEKPDYNYGGLPRPQEFLDNCVDDEIIFPWKINHFMYIDHRGVAWKAEEVAIFSGMSEIDRTFFHGKFSQLVKQGLASEVDDDIIITSPIGYDPEWEIIPVKFEYKDKKEEDQKYTYAKYIKLDNKIDILKLKFHEKT